MPHLQNDAAVTVIAYYPLQAARLVASIVSNMYY